MAGSFTLCGITLLISVGLKPLLSPGRGFLRPLAKQEVLWEAGWVEEGLGLANGGVGPVKEDRPRAEASQTSTCFLYHGCSGILVSHNPLGLQGSWDIEDIIIPNEKQVRYYLLSLAFCLRL